jgi:hypothetical protein
MRGIILTGRQRRVTLKCITSSKEFGRGKFCQVVAALIPPSLILTPCSSRKESTVSIYFGFICIRMSFTRRGLHFIVLQRTGSITKRVQQTHGDAVESTRNYYLKGFIQSQIHLKRPRRSLSNSNRHNSESRIQIIDRYITFRVDDVTITTARLQRTV